MGEVAELSGRIADGGNCRTFSWLLGLQAARVAELVMVSCLMGITRPTPVRHQAQRGFPTAGAVGSIGRRSSPAHNRRRYASMSKL